MLEKDIFVKVCGITSQKDADVVSELGADLIGFIFDKKSPRYISPEDCHAITTPGLMRVGVFTGHTLEEVRDIMKRATLDLAQLHGDFDISFAEQLGRTKVLRVLWPERYNTNEEMVEDMQRHAHCTRFFLFDAGSSGGGHGKEQDWDFLAGTRAVKTWFIAGGLGPDNLKKAVMACNPCGLDFNSGVESTPGVKDHEKLRKVFAMLNNKLL